MSTRKWLTLTAVVLVPPTVVLAVGVWREWIPVDLGSWSGWGSLLVAYGGWAAFVAAIAQLAGYLREEGVQPPKVRARFEAPPVLREFVGREEQIRQLVREIKPGGKVAITGLVGMGGVGKTELAKVVSSRVAPRFSDGVLWADCGGQGVESIASRWAGSFGVELMGDSVAAKAAEWRGLVSGKEVLLVFDNVQPNQEVEVLFPPHGRSAVLLTTREVDHPALRSLSPLRLDTFDPREAMALAEEVLGRENARRQAGDAERLFNLVGCLPLGVAVALRLAEQCGWTLEVVNRRLQERGALVVLGDEEKGRKSLRATFEAAWEALGSELKETLRTLVVFNEGPSFSTAAVADTMRLDAEDAGARLQRLEGRSLLAGVGEERWTLHPLLRIFTAEKGPLEDVVWARMARHYAAVAAHADELYLRGGMDLLQGLGLFDLEWPHIQAGQVWAAAKAGTVEEAARLACEYGSGMGYCLDLRLSSAQRFDWLEPAVAAARSLGDRRREGFCLGNLGRAYNRKGDSQKAIEYLRQALNIAQEIREGLPPRSPEWAAARRDEGVWLGILGSAYSDRGDSQNAIEWCTQALEIAREIGDRRSEGIHLTNLGRTFTGIGETRQAIECHQEALSIAREVGDRRGEANRLGNLGRAYARRHDLRKAIDLHGQAFDMAQELGDRRGQEVELGSLGQAYAASGETRKALSCFEQALRIARELEDQSSVARQLSNLGSARVELGKFDAGMENLREALEVVHEIGDRRSEGWYLGNLGRVYERLGDSQRAFEQFQEALSIAREVSDRRQEGWNLGRLGRVYASKGESKVAMVHMEQALEIAREVGDRQLESLELTGLGRLYTSQGEHDRASELLTEALRILTEIGDPKAEQVRQLLEELGQ